jgi:hypothetical protein
VAHHAALGSLLGRHFLELPPQGCDLDVTLCDCQRYPVKRFVGSLHAVSPQRPGRPQHRNVGCSRQVRIEWRPISGKPG